MHLIPHSGGSDNRPVSVRLERYLCEFNPNHYPGGSSKGGQFAPRQGGQYAAAQKGGGAYTQPTPIKVSNIGKAVSLILQGKVVELTTVKQVNTVLTKLAAIARDAKKRGEDAPKYDLCNVSVAGTNLFCGSKLRTKDYPDGVPRIQMPQFSGEPRKGSTADQLPKDKHGHVDGSAAFVSYLKNSLGIKTTLESVTAASLKASQSQLDGVKVARMMGKTNITERPIFISRDNYVIDGHHRWAARVGQDASDNKLGGLKMPVYRVNAPISEVLKIGSKWAKSYGIKPKQLTGKF